MADVRKEAFPAYWFQVSLDFAKEEIFRFRSCTGLKSESAVVDLDEGGFNVTTRKLIGKTKFPNIVLKHGFMGADSILWKQRQKFQLDNPKKGADKVTTDQLSRGRALPNRFSGQITAMGPNGATASFGFANGWICKWEGPDLDATKNEVAIESIEIAHEGLFVIPTPAKSSGNQGGGGQGSGNKGA